MWMINLFMLLQRKNALVVFQNVITCFPSRLYGLSSQKLFFLPFLSTPPTNSHTEITHHHPINRILCLALHFFPGILNILLLLLLFYYRNENNPNIIYIIEVNLVANSISGWLLITLVMLMFSNVFVRISWGICQPYIEISVMSKLTGWRQMNYNCLKILSRHSSYSLERPCLSLKG